MHIAQFIQRFPPALGGSEHYTRLLCNYFAQCGDSVTVWTSEAVPLWSMWRGRMSRVEKAQVARQEAAQRTRDTSVHAGVELRQYLPLRFPLRRYALKALSLFPHRRWQCLTSPCSPVCPAMWRDVNRFEGPLDAVHAAAFPYGFPLACGLRLARRKGVPFLLTPFLHLGDVHDATNLTRRQYTSPRLRWLLNEADRIFAQTNLERGAIISLGIPEERVILQGQGTTPSECTGGDRDRARRAWGVRPDEVVLGHLSNNSVEKGTVDLLRAAEIAWSHGEEFRVVLAGPEMPNFRRFWDRFRHKDRVTRLGAFSEADRRDFYAGIDFFSLPSRCDSFGLVLIEAWANGKPNVVYRAGGPAELVRHEVDGLQAACGDVNELAARYVRLVRDAELRRRLGANGQPRVEKEFLWQDKFEIVRETIQELVERRPAARVSLSAPCRIAS